MESDEIARLRALAEQFGELKIRELLELENSVEGWEDMGVENGVESSRLYVPETGFYVVKGIGDIEFPAEVILRVISDASRKGEWDQMFVEGRVVVDITPDTRISYQHFSTPWPVSHRDFVYLSLFRQISENCVISLGFSIETPLVPDVRGLVRGHMHIAGFILRAITPTLTRVAYIVHIDPRGSIPTMIINKIQRKQAQNISKIRNYLIRTS